MVAYGVLEMKHKPGITPDPWLAARDDGELERARKDDYERDQLRKLVNDELRCYDLLLKRITVPHHNRYRTKANAHILYGQVQRSGFTYRPVLCEGDFRECCIVAAAKLDELDASQIPDTATGPA